jgi:hypothetical protein
MARNESQPAPRTFKQAMKSPDAAKWLQAAKTEYNGIIKMNVFELVPRPNDKNIVGSTWNFRVKLDDKGNVARYKARLCAQGFTQEEGIDYDETYAPVAKLNSLRTLFTVAAKDELLVWHFDVETAFLHGELDKELFMEQPEGFVDSTHPNHVCKMLKALYGFKQSGRLWWINFANYLTEKLKFSQNSADTNVYTKEVSPGKYMHALVYVDDVTVAATKSDYTEFRDNVARGFNIKDLGEIKWILGIAVSHTKNNKFFLSQKAYLSATLEQFGMQDCKSIATPTCGGDIQIAASHEGNPCDATLYKSIVGKIMYAMVCTRPDLAFAITLLTRNMQSPTEQHMQMALRVLRYIKGTLDYGILLGNDYKTYLVPYCDANWAGDIGDRKSTGGYAIFLHGSPIAWQSRKQKVVAQSTAESEYMELSNTTKEAVWFDVLLSGMHHLTPRPHVIYEDNQSAIHMAGNGNNHGRTKHIDVRYHYIREKIKEGVVTIQHIPTDQQIADIFTKPLPRPRFEALRALLGVTRLNSTSPSSLKGEY